MLKLTHIKAKKQNDKEGKSGPWLLGNRRVVYGNNSVACDNRLVSSKHMHKSQKRLPQCLTHSFSVRHTRLLLTSDGLSEHYFSMNCHVILVPFLIMSVSFSTIKYTKPRIIIMFFIIKQIPNNSRIIRKKNKTKWLRLINLSLSKYYGEFWVTKFNERHTHFSI